MADNLECESGAFSESASLGNSVVGTGMSSRLHAGNCKDSQKGGYDFKKPRPASAPPIARLSTKNITMDEIAYASFYRRNSRTDPRLPLPNFVVEGQGSIFYENTRLLETAFSSFAITDKFKKSLVEQIDEDYPESETSEYTGTSRASTPVGDRSGMSPSRPAVVCANRFLIDLTIFARKVDPFNVVEEKDLCFEMSRDQEGSRFIQKRLETAMVVEKVWFFRQVVDRISELSRDLFGNYIVQKFLATGDVCLFGSDSDIIDPAKEGMIVYQDPFDKVAETVSFRTEILDRLRGGMRELSYDAYGCRVVQKLLEVTDFDVCREFGGHVIDMVKDQNGNHVVQKCIERFHKETFVIRAFEESACEMAKHKYGCRAIQRLFENRKEEDCAQIIRRILESTEEMVFDQYGNYVIQHILEFGRKEFRDTVFRTVVGNVYEISVHKFASNVMEKCVLVSDDAQRRSLMTEFMMTRGQKPLLLSMCLNSFANYVVQRLIDTVDAKDRQRIRDVLRPYFGELRRSVYSKQILSKIY